MKKLSKKIFSLILSVLILSVGIVPTAMSSYAADYSKKLKEKGFPDSYISALCTLHEKYPEWDFEPFQTNLKWEDAVDGERSSHSKQLIQKNPRFQVRIIAAAPNAKKTVLMSFRKVLRGFRLPKKP